MKYGCPKCKKSIILTGEINVGQSRNECIGSHFICRCGFVACMQTLSDSTHGEVMGTISKATCKEDDIVKKLIVFIIHSSLDPNLKLVFKELFDTFQKVVLKGSLFECFCLHRGKHLHHK